MLASLSKCYLVYADCVRSGGEKLSIVAAITDGNSDHVMVGRVVFYDHQGRDWDATVTKDHRQSHQHSAGVLGSPTRAFCGLWKTDCQAARSSSGCRNRTRWSKDAATKTGGGSDKGNKADPKAPPKKWTSEPSLPLGVAVGGIATFHQHLGPVFWLGPVDAARNLALLLSISLPSMPIAWLKLRLRSPGTDPGWKRLGGQFLVRINVPFGASLTSLSSIPLGSDRSLPRSVCGKSSVHSLYVVLLALSLRLRSLGVWEKNRCVPASKGSARDRYG